MFLKPKNTAVINPQRTPDEDRRAAIADVINQSYARETKLRQSKVLKQKEQMAQQQAQKQSGGGGILQNIFNMFLGAS